MNRGGAHQSRGHRVLCKTRKLPRIHGVGAGHDGAVALLAEDLLQVDHGDHARLQGSFQHRPRTHRGQLIGITCISQLQPSSALLARRGLMLLAANGSIYAMPA